MNRYDILIIVSTVVILYGAAVVAKALPSIDAFAKFVSLIDSKGGNILILGGLAIYFYHDTTMAYFRVMDLIQASKIAADNGIALNALTFSATAFGSVSGALLKVMSGTEPPPATQTTTVTSVSKTP